MWYRRGPACLLALIAVAGCRDSQREQWLDSSEDGGVTDAALPSVHSASVEGCGDAQIHDTGQVVYLISSRECPEGTKRVVLSFGTSTLVEQYRIDLTGFGDQRSVNFKGNSWRVVSVHRAGSWRSFPNQRSWSWRDGAGLLAKDGGLYLLGGWSGDLGKNSEVWFTSDLQQWHQLTDRAPWEARHGAGWVVHGDRLYVISGDLLNDVWSSADGMDWRLHVSHAPFGGRYAPSAASDGENRILFWGGQDWIADPTCSSGPLCGAVGFNDVWQTKEGDRTGALGRRWTRVLAAAPWAGRGLVHGGVFFKGRFYVIGGGLKAILPGSPYAETVAEYSDIWSSADGVDWRLESEDLGIPPRTHFAILGTDHGCYLANGSLVTQFNTTSEVFFASDCIHYSEVDDPSPMGTRHASSLALFNGSIVVLGGHGTTAGTSVWQYFPDVPDPRT